MYQFDLLTNFKPFKEQNIAKFFISLQAFHIAVKCHLGCEMLKVINKSFPDINLIFLLGMRCLLHFNPYHVGHNCLDDLV